MSSYDTLMLASDEKLVDIRPVKLNLPQQPEHPLAVLRRAAHLPPGARLTRPLDAAAFDPDNQQEPELQRYQDFYGRDGLISALLLRRLLPDLLAATVDYLAAYQAIGYDYQQQSFLGSVPHRVRSTQDAGARANDPRAFPFHGPRDTTLWWLLAISHVLKEHPETFDTAIRHSEGEPFAGHVVMRGDEPQTRGRAFIDGVIFLLGQLLTSNGPGLVWTPINLGKGAFWDEIDSPNGYSDRDGTIPKPPARYVQGNPEAYLAPLGLQAQAYHAAFTAARTLELLERRLNEPGVGQANRSLLKLRPYQEAKLDRLGIGRLDSQVLRQYAAEIKRNILKHYWIADDERGAYFGSAVYDRGGSWYALRSITDRMVYVLDSPMLAEEDQRHIRETVLAQLFSERMLTAYGLLGRSRDDIRYTDFDYHSCVWLHRTLIGALGMARHGYWEIAYELMARGMRQTEDGCCPENVSGGAILYCPHILTVELRANALGQPIRMVKERPSQLRQTWPAAAAVVIDWLGHQRRQTSDPECIRFENELLSRIPPEERAFQSIKDLQWGTHYQRKHTRV